MTNLTLETVRLLLETEEYKLLNEEINSSKDTLFLICPNNHEYKVGYTNFTSGKRRCSECKKLEKSYRYYQEFEELLKEEGYAIKSTSKRLSTKREKYEVNCPQDHIWNVSFSDFKSGARCSSCNPSYKPKLSQEEVKKRYQEEGYELISEYANARSKINAICPNGHEWMHTHDSFQRGSRCYECFGYKKYTLEQAKNFFTEKNFTPTFSEYDGNKQMLSFVCNEHSDYGEQYCSLHNLIRDTANCQVCYRNKFRGESSSRWTGGNSDVSKLIRDFIFDKWTLPSLAKYGFVCVLSGEKSDLEVHHASKSYHAIIEDTLTSLGFEDKKKLKDFTLDEIELLKSKVLDNHFDLGFGFPLTKKIHKLFHIIYGFKNNNMNQFIEFKKDYDSGKFHDYFGKEETYDN